MNLNETKTVFIAIVGRPNVGKSTLLNHLLGEKIAAVSKKPQTTRTKITGILTRENVQYVFLDTPGFHKPKTKLGDIMVGEISDAMADVDCIYFVVEGNGEIHPAELQMMSRFKKDIPVILLINKCDICKKDMILQTMALFNEKFDFVSLIPISAATGEGVDIIFKETEPFINVGDWYFDSDMITDQPERKIAAEIIREKILRLTDDEVPHGTAVVIEDFKDIRGHVLDIRAEIFCEKASHKGILIGKNGDMLKKIGTYARLDMEEFFGVKVNLNLWVKVKPDWRENDLYLNTLGFDPKRKS